MASAFYLICLLIPTFVSLSFFIFFVSSYGLMTKLEK